jgi:3-hydroxyisobutyrate dehydrogenase
MGYFVLLPVGMNMAAQNIYIRDVQLEHEGDVIDFIKLQMEQGVVDRNHPYHLVNVATVDADGFPTARTVVLRHFNWGQGVLRFHTDLRSPKIQEIQNNPAVSIQCYSLEHKVQLRFKAVASIISQAEMNRQKWLQMKAYSRRCYTISEAPGTQLEYNDVGRVSNVNANPISAIPFGDEHDKSAFENFVIVECRILSVDFLHLASDGHVRAQVKLGNGSASVAWVAP